MDYTNLRMLDLYERVLGHVKPGDEDAPLIVEGREICENLRKDIAEDARERLEILEECCDDVTEPPWCGFSDDGKTYAVMAAGRPFDVFTFEKPPKEADAHYLLLAQPHIIKAMIDRIRKLEILASIESEQRWTNDSKEEEDDKHRESSGAEPAE